MTAIIRGALLSALLAMLAPPPTKADDATALAMQLPQELSLGASDAMRSIGFLPGSASWIYQDAGSSRHTVAIARGRMLFCLSSGWTSTSPTLREAGVRFGEKLRIGARVAYDRRDVATSESRLETVVSQESRLTSAARAELTFAVVSPRSSGVSGTLSVGRNGVRQRWDASNVDPPDGRRDADLDWGGRIQARVSGDRGTFAGEAGYSRHRIRFGSVWRGRRLNYSAFDPPRSSSYFIGGRLDRIVHPATTVRLSLWAVQHRSARIEYDYLAVTADQTFDATAGMSCGVEYSCGRHWLLRGGGALAWERPRSDRRRVNLLNNLGSMAMADGRATGSTLHSRFSTGIGFRARGLALNAVFAGRTTLANAFEALDIMVEF